MNAPSSKNAEREMAVADLQSTSGIALSADGKELVYVATRDGVQQLYRRSLDQLNAAAIPGTEGAEFPFFSPDGEWVGFFADGKLKTVSLAAALPSTLCDADYRYGASWGADDIIMFVSDEHSGLMQVPAAGGEPLPITTPDTNHGELGHRWLDFLPGATAVLFTIWYDSLEIAQIAVQSLMTGQRKMLIGGTNPRYSPTGHIVFAREDSLWAVPFDAERLEVTGSPTRLVEGVRVGIDGLANFSLAGNGSLVYMTGSDQSPTEPPQLNVVLNWSRELLEKVPVN